MSDTSWVVKGQRRNKVKTRGSKWGPGKVHMTVYLRKFKVYIKGCDSDDPVKNMSILMGGELNSTRVPRSEPLTCKKCIKKFGADA